MSSRYSISRQKACQQCSGAKARCDHKAGGCSRCAQRGLPCSYPRAHATPSRHSPRQDENKNAEPSTYVTPSPSKSEIVSQVNFPESVATVRTPRFDDDGQRSLDFSFLELDCPIQAEDIASRWLNSYIPGPEQVPKQYDPKLSGFIYRVLKSYANCVIRGRGLPPFVHPSQMMLEPPPSSPSPLATCMSIVRICETSFPGSEAAAADVLQQEMVKLHERHAVCSDMDLLATFQAYLILALVLFFRVHQGIHPFLRQAMMNLQEIACATARRGLVCVADHQRARPSWESWIVSESKRRTLYTMYLFDNVLSTVDGLAAFLGTELRGLPAPFGKPLWEAKARRDWEAIYNIHLAEWPEGSLCVDELWAMPPDLDASGIATRRDRVDRWLENVDEFGMMIYAVTTCTHGG